LIQINRHVLPEHASGNGGGVSVKWLIGKMETREFVYLKQVMSLVILKLWHRVFIDGEGGEGA
jgi:hypothetical protein